MAKFRPCQGTLVRFTGTAIVDGKISRSKFEKASYKLLSSNSNPSSAIQGAFYQTPRVLINVRLCNVTQEGFNLTTGSLDYRTNMLYLSSRISTYKVPLKVV